MKNTQTHKLVIDFPEKVLTPYFAGNQNDLLQKYLSVRDVTTDDSKINRRIKRRDPRDVMVIYVPKEAKYEIKAMAAGKTPMDKWATMNKKKSWTFKVKPITSDDKTKTVKQTKGGEVATETTSEKDTIVLKIRTVDFAYPLFEDGIVSAIIHQVIEKRLKRYTNHFVGLKTVEISRNLLVPMYQLENINKFKSFSVSTNNKEMVSVREIEFIKRPFGLPKSIPLKNIDLNRIADIYMARIMTEENEKVRRTNQIKRRFDNKKKSMKSVDDQLLLTSIGKEYDEEVARKKKGERYSKIDEISKFLRDYLLQIFYALYVAQKEIGLVHGDLFVKNIMVDELDENFDNMEIKIGEDSYLIGRKINKEKIPLIKIIDFDFSRINFKLPMREGDKAVDDVEDDYKRLAGITETYLDKVSYPQFKMTKPTTTTTKLPTNTNIFGLRKETLKDDTNELKKDQFNYNLLLAAYNKKYDFLKFLSKRRKLLNPEKVSEFYGLGSKEIDNFEAYFNAEGGKLVGEVAKYKIWKKKRSKLQKAKKRIEIGKFEEKTKEDVSTAKKKRGKILLNQLFKLYTEWYATIGYSMSYMGVAKINDAKTLITQLLFGRNYTSRRDPTKQHYQRRLLPYIATIETSNDHKELLEFLSFFYKGLTFKSGSNVAENFLHCLTFYYIFERFKANENKRNVKKELHEIFTHYTRYDKKLEKIEYASANDSIFGNILKKEYKDLINEEGITTENGNMKIPGKKIPSGPLLSRVEEIKKYNHKKSVNFDFPVTEVEKIEDKKQGSSTETLTGNVTMRIPLTFTYVTQSLKNKIRTILKEQTCPVFFTSSKSMQRYAIKSFEHERQKLIFFWLFDNYNRYKPFIKEKLWGGKKKKGVKKMLDDSYDTDDGKIYFETVLKSEDGEIDYSGDYENADSKLIPDEIKNNLKMVEAQFFYVSLRNIFYFLHEDDYNYSMESIITNKKVKNFFNLHNADVEDNAKIKTFTYP